ncbi:hypothetical protein ACFLT5_02910 [Chloroflexota bacterium]
MSVADQYSVPSEMALRQTGYVALIESLGFADAIRFPLQPSPGEGVYMELQDRLLGAARVDELYQ